MATRTALAAGSSIAVVAHRGASADAPENTLPAVELGVQQADYVEVDVHMTSDGHLVVTHDGTLGRTTDAAARYPDRAPWATEDLTFEEIRALDAGGWFSELHAGTRVPELREVLDVVRGRAGLLLEVKTPKRYPGIGAAVTSALWREGWLGSEHLVVQSFDWAFVAAVATVAPEVRVGLLGDPPPAEELLRFSAWVEQMNPGHEQVTADMVQAVHEHGMTMWPYTVDCRQRMHELRQLGVDGLITNVPDQAVQALHEKERAVA